MGRLLMAYWDCEYCGTKGIEGSKRECSNCGRPRGNVKFYMKHLQEGREYKASEVAGQEYVSSEQAAKVSKGPDWYCSYCDSLNNSEATVCKGCGATREDSEKNYFDLQKKPVAPPPTRPQNFNKGCLKPILIIAAVIIGLALLGLFMNSNKTTGQKIVDVSWQRVINIEQNKEVFENDWNLPNDARLERKAEEVHHYDEVLDHYENVEVQRSRQVLDHYETTYTYEDRGNGYFEEISHENPVYKTEYYYETESQPVYVSVPRYQTKYYYYIWRWVKVRDVSASNQDKKPFWPEYTLAEDERKGTTEEVYTITVEDEKGKTKTYRLSESVWNDYNKGDEIYITATRTGSHPFISDKDGNKIADIME